MKLRIQGNSLRLRLSEIEVEQFYGEGHLSDEIIFGPDQNMIFQLLKSDQYEQLFASLKGNLIQVFVPVTMAKNWAQSDLVGLEAYQELPKNQQLKILIEKDFPCTHKRKEQ